MVSQRRQLDADRRGGRLRHRQAPARPVGPASSPPPRSCRSACSSPIGGALADRLEPPQVRAVHQPRRGDRWHRCLRGWPSPVAPSSGHRGAAWCSSPVASTAIALPFLQAMTLDLVPRTTSWPRPALAPRNTTWAVSSARRLAGLVIAVWGYQWAFTHQRHQLLRGGRRDVVACAYATRRSTDATPLLERIRVGARAASANPGARAAITTIAIRRALLLSPVHRADPGAGLSARGRRRRAGLDHDAFASPSAASPATSRRRRASAP